jgi:hypothetical protein
VRVAIAANRRQILSLVLGRAARLAAIGLAPGIAVATASGRVLSGLLFGIAGSDVGRLAVVAAVMMTVSLVRCGRCASADPGACGRNARAEN